MRENKKFRGPGKRPAPIDGIFTGSRELGLPVNRAYRPDRRVENPNLDKAMNRDDGFHPMNTSLGGPNPSPEADEAALLDAPIVLEDIKPDKKRHSRRLKGARRLKKPILIASILFVAVIGYFGIRFYITQHDLFRGGGRAPALASRIDIKQLKGEGDGRINILLLGIGGPGHEGPDLTDTILLASVDPVNNKVSMLSIPRDLWVKIPGNGYQKINAAYPDGKLESRAKTEAGKDQDGLNLLDQTLEPVIGISIHYHAVVDFKAFKDLVDSLGGVTFNVPERLYDPTIAWENYNNPVIAKQGMQTMHGQQALLYARSRETSSDFARGQRQRQLLVAVKDKALSLGTFSNPVKVSNLLRSLSNNVYTDFSLNDMERLYQIGTKITSSSISSLDFVTPPHAYLTTAPINGLSTVVPKAGQGNYSDIQSFVRNELRDGFLAKENASLAVYNATDVAGLAASKAAVLKSYGYNITTVANAVKASNPAKTTVVDLTKNKDIYTRHYLEQRFNTTAVTSMPASAGITPPVGSNFVIILGEDAANSN